MGLRRYKFGGTNGLNCKIFYFQTEYPVRRAVSSISKVETVLSFNTEESPEKNLKHQLRVLQDRLDEVKERTR